jgi:hypothetical protein
VSNAAQLGAVLYEAETNWGEDVTTFATHRLPVLDAVDPSGLTHAKIDPNRVNQYLQDGQPHILGVMGGSFKTRMHATGHGVTTSGAFTVDALETFLSYIFSGAGAAGAGGTVTASATAGTTASGGTATALTTVASGTFTAGGLFRLGAQNDGRGNGQAGVVASHVTTTLTSLTAFDGAPSGTDVVFTGANLYLPETPTNSTVTSLRFALVTANLVYECHGCFPMAVTLKGIGPGQLPVWEIDWGVSWWRLNTAIGFPSSVTSNQYAPAACAGGSLFINDVGTATRAAANKRVYRDLSIDIKLGIVPLPGPGGVNQYQNIVGARRVPSDVRWKWTEDADAKTLTPVLESYFLGATSKHALVTLSPINGQSVSAYAPNLRVVGARPVQKAFNKINSIMVECEANTGPTSTSELTLSATRFFYS